MTTPHGPLRVRVHHGQPVVAGRPLALRVSIAHPMVTDHQVDAQGRRLGRNILTRFECHGADGLLFAASLHPAIAANPSLQFWIRPHQSQTLRLRWEGDHGFVQEHRYALDVQEG